MNYTAVRAFLKIEGDDKLLSCTIFLYKNNGYFKVSKG